MDLRLEVAKRVFFAHINLLFALTVLSGAAFAEPRITPEPHKMVWDGPVSVKKAYTLKADGAVPASVVREYAARLEEWGFKKGEGGIEVALKRLPIAECEKAAAPPYQKKTILEYSSLQAYFLKTTSAKVEARACGEDGFYYALLTLGNLWRDSPLGVLLDKVEITDYPDFPVRGIFEGGYGIWEVEGRLRVIDWMGGAKLNAYLYGPKSDPKIRRRWRALYDDVELFQFKRMLQRMKESHIQMSYVIAPTLGMEYGGDEDFKTLLRKARQMQSLGVRGFILAFDDTLGMLYHPRDRKKFKNLGEAEAFLTNRLYEALKKFDPEASVGMVPEIYSGVYDMEYTRSLAEKLLPEIYIGWTGDEIVAPKIDAASMKAFIDFYDRMPSIGDNWGSIFPLVARSADISKYTTQFLVNPYNLQREEPGPGIVPASEPDLMPVEGASVAEFGWNAFAFSPDETIDKLAVKYFKPEAREIFKLLMYREARQYLSGPAQKYTPPPAREAETLLVNKDEAGMKEFAERMGMALEGASNAADLLKSDCDDRRLGDALAKRATEAAGYFAGLAGAALALREGVEKGDREAQLKAVQAFLDELKGK